MRFFFLMLIFGVGVIALECTWLAGRPSETLRFDLILVAVAAIAFTREWKEATPVIVLFGCLTDVASNHIFGMSVFSYFVAYAFVRIVVAQISVQAGFGLAFWVAIVSVIDKLSRSLVLLIATNEGTLSQVILRCLPAQVLLDALVSLIAVPMILWFGRLSTDTFRRQRGLMSA